MMKRILKKIFPKTGFAIAPTRVRLTLPKPSTLHNLRILHISDLHIDTKTPIEDIEALVRCINATPCDIAVCTGDIIDAQVDKIEHKLLMLRHIQKPLYCISGNHDLVYGYEKLCKILRRCNVTMLDNRYLIVRHKHNDFVLWGLSDRFSRFFHIQRNEDTLVRQIRNISLPKICIAHQPKDYKYSILTHSALFLCGHTHGGQIFPFHLLVRLFQPFLRGIYYKKGVTVYVNSGLGAWGIKYRFLSRAEIALIEVDARKP